MSTCNYCGRVTEEPRNEVIFWIGVGLALGIGVTTLTPMMTT